MRTSKYGESNATALEDLTLRAVNPVKEVLLKLELTDTSYIILLYKRRCYSLIPTESNSLPHAHAQTTKTYYWHQDSRIKKAQVHTKIKTFANSDIQDLPLRPQVYQGRLLASFQDDAKYEHIVSDEQAEVRVSDLGEKESKGEEEEVENRNDELVWENHDVTDENGGEKGDHGKGKSPTVSPNNGKTQESSNVSENVKVSYAKMITSNDTKIDKTLCYIPTTIGENGSDVAIFDEDLETMGFGKQSLVSGGRPLLVQKWSPDVSFEKNEPDNIPLWIKMFDILLEAWSAKGISTLASSLGKLIVMDDMAAQISIQGQEWTYFNHEEMARTAEDMTKIQGEG
ncbi:retrovirus-related pol polyprotein from transposon TNT 1-94 [Tanacetum coccineum]|uniref:Retrovirus-related pol polyprotein from transposon TNT 1-94 n=1 Tax=Tanacetum coccineum TaxID=301880 RepID=A0ABQ5GAL3_9ASTR